MEIPPKINPQGPKFSAQAPELAPQDAELPAQDSYILFERVEAVPVALIEIESPFHNPKVFMNYCSKTIVESKVFPGVTFTIKKMTKLPHFRER